MRADAVVCLLPALAVLAGPGAPAATEVPPAADTIAVRATAIPLDRLDPERRRVGALTYRGGLVLASDDPRFGGLSGLHVDEDGRRLVAVTDRGHAVMGTLEYGEGGDLRGLCDVSLRPLLAEDGRPLPSDWEGDAEALTRLDDGRLVVAFERWHRLWTYAGESPFTQAAEPMAAPPDVDGMPDNEGMEAIAALDEGALVVLTEGVDDTGAVRGWLRRGAEWTRLSYPVEGALRPTDAVRLPDGDLLVLERGHSLPHGLAARLRRVAARAVTPGATLDGEIVADLRGPLDVDNFEAIAARRDASGETVLYLLSDDNFSPAQRTLLLTFVLDPR